MEKKKKSVKDNFTNFFIDTIKELRTIFKKHNIEYAILGGLAAGAWGRARATDDIDLVIHVSGDKLDNLMNIFKKYKYQVRIMGYDNLPDLIELRKKRGDLEIRVDIMLAKIPYQEKVMERKVMLKIFDTEIPFISPEDLIIHKLIANRPIDIQDVENIFRFNYKNLDIEYLKKWAKEWEIEESLNKMIEKFSKNS